MENAERKITINISTSTIIKILGILLGLAILYILRDVILLLVIALVLASALNPWVGALQRKGLPRFVATLLIFLAFVAVFVVILGLLIPPIAGEISDITNNFPTYYNRIASDFQHFKEFSAQQNILKGIESSLQSLQSNVGQTATSIFGGVITVFGGFFSFIVVMVIAFYTLLEENAFKKMIKSLTPTKYQAYVFQIMNRSQERLQQWLKGQIILCVIIGAMAYIGLLIMGVKYSLVLGLWSGLTEFIPYLGPLLGGIPAVFIAITTGSPIKALFVIIWFIIIHQAENHLITPKVMQRTVGLNPLVIIIVMLIGGKLVGVIGVIIALPIALIVKVFAEDFFSLHEESEDKLEA